MQAALFLRNREVRRKNEEKGVFSEPFSKLANKVNKTARSKVQVRENGRKIWIFNISSHFIEPELSPQLWYVKNKKPTRNLKQIYEIFGNGINQFFTDTWDFVKCECVYLWFLCGNKELQ